jgi:beta-N-acetylhexosaminidase
MSLGPAMVDIEGTALTPADEARLRHPLVGGVILFTRNYESPRQLCALTASIHALRTPPLLIAVDHEGGRVQRFREGFTRLPAMRELGRIWDTHPQRARHLAQQAGWVLAAELRACGVDLSFAPVLDIDHGASCVIGDRAFHRDPQAVAELARGLVLGLKQGGTGAVGKHFPGHGFIAADSHLEVPVDERDFADLRMCDLIPFQQLIDAGLPAIMPAHVIYPRVDSRPAGFSDIWLKDILRGEMEFDGCIFSDDLSMEGASVAGGIAERAIAALEAGCDMVLVCNDAAAADRLLATLEWDMPPVSRARIARMHGRPQPEGLVRLHEDGLFVKAVHEVGSVGLESGNLDLGTCGNR